MNYKRISYFQYNPYSARIIFITDCILRTGGKKEEKEEKEREEERHGGRIRRDTMEGFSITVKEYKG